LIKTSRLKVITAILLGMNVEGIMVEKKGVPFFSAARRYL